MALHEILKSERISHNICTPPFVGISPSIEPETVNTSALKHGPQTGLRSPRSRHQTLPTHYLLALLPWLSISLCLPFPISLFPFLFRSSCPPYIHGGDYSSFNDHLFVIQLDIVTHQAKRQASVWCQKVKLLTADPKLPRPFSFQSRLL